MGRLPLLKQQAISEPRRVLEDILIWVQEEPRWAKSPLWVEMGVSGTREFVTVTRNSTDYHDPLTVTWRPTVSMAHGRSVALSRCRQATRRVAPGALRALGFRRKGRLRIFHEEKGGELGVRACCAARAYFAATRRRGEGEARRERPRPGPATQTVAQIV